VRDIIQPGTIKKERIQHKAKEKDWRQEFSMLNPNSLIVQTRKQYFQGESA
jgi:hypothetical protein